MRKLIFFPNETREEVWQVFFISGYKYMSQFTDRTGDEIITLSLFATHGALCSKKENVPYVITSGANLFFFNFVGSGITSSHVGINRS